MNFSGLFTLRECELSARITLAIGSTDRVPVREGYGFTVSIIAHLVRNEAPWVRKFGYLCIQEILVLRKSFVRRTCIPSCKLG